MAAELLEIHPQELKFTFELKKQSSCLIQLTNKTDQYVAFKVKTTSPKKYCVRPNTGIVKPKSTSDFTVTMQAQRVAPPDLMCKDKFLIQSTIVPFGTAEEDITSDMFSKDSGKHIDEKKLKVFLTSPPQSPVLAPINGELKQDSGHETSSPKDRASSGVENIPPPQRVAEDVVGFETSKDAVELITTKDVLRFDTSKDDTAELRAADGVQSGPAKDVEELKPAKGMVELKSGDDFEELKSKLSFMDSKLKEAERSIMKLTEERSIATREKDKLKGELELLKRKSDVRTIQVGFPFLYVCMVALVSLAVGYFSHL
ncbi:PREDICTED: vesicle-associated protein 2-2 [Theobroma cacao]|uniref:Vesicle-associated protein 2-2 n=2 Tax=Theobroma cacao TaxID=3641 RepID=A0AB32V8C2_THECC|nr:PREDICTED: vesicle-associated protein 2-2 [Theobroma cacao]EOY06388.1 Vesicle-associated membrane protein, putative isoform 1 [Theobroma cacao]